MSAIGTKQTWGSALHISAIGGEADIASASQNDRDFDLAALSFDRSKQIKIS
jgi:hypothetical protein